MGCVGGRGQELTGSSQPAVILAMRPLSGKVPPIATRPMLMPYRGAFGAERPPALASLDLPPGPMPSHRGLRPLQAWRYVGVYGAEVMVCIASVRIGPVRQSFWALWDRAEGRLYERTALGSCGVQLSRGSVRIRDPGLALDLALEETDGIETVCPSAGNYAWTRKQGGIPASGSFELSTRRRRFVARAVVDDTAAYYPRHTSWRWSAGVGIAVDERPVAWNLVTGINDPPRDSERTVWIDGEPMEVGPCRFADDLSAVDTLRFEAEATRERSENLLLARSRYHQPFGTFSGMLPDGPVLAEGYGVMEHHDVWW